MENGITRADTRMHLRAEHVSAASGEQDVPKKIWWTSPVPHSHRGFAA